MMKKTVKVSFPENYGNKELSGRAAEFKCKIKEVSGPCYQNLMMN